MSIHLTIVDADGHPVEGLEELALTLCADGRPIARGTSKGHGVLVFDTAVEGLGRLTLHAEPVAPTD